MHQSKKSLSKADKCLGASNDTLIDFVVHQDSPLWMSVLCAPTESDSHAALQMQVWDRNTKDIAISQKKSPA